MFNLIPVALGAIGGIQGYKQARRSGASGLGALFGGALGAYGGYSLGSALPFAKPAASIASTGISAATAGSPFAAGQLGAKMTAAELAKQQTGKIGLDQIKQALLMKSDGSGFSPFKISALAGAVPFALGAFDQQPTDIYSPGYNTNYPDFLANRPGFTYIDPSTGKEVEYEKVYIPEADPKNQQLKSQRFNQGGLAELQNFNEGGINYLPSKVTHDENDSNNYVRAHGYVEDGSGNGDKDEDTMLAQLADGEFVTRADGVLGAGIIAGANPNSMKDMREKGAQYFYQQQARYKRVFDLLKEKNGDSKQKTN